MTDQVTPDKRAKLGRKYIITEAARALRWSSKEVEAEPNKSPTTMILPPPSLSAASVSFDNNALDDDVTFAQILAHFNAPHSSGDDSDNNNAPYCIVGAIDRQTRAIERTAHSHDLRDVNLALIGLGEKLIASEERQVDRVAVMTEKVAEIISNTILAGLKADREERAARRAEDERNKQAERERIERAEALLAKREPCAPLAVLQADRHKYPCLVAIDKTAMLNDAQVASASALDTLRGRIERLEGDGEWGTNPATQAELHRQIKRLEDEISKLKADVTHINNDRP